MLVLVIRGGIEDAIRAARQHLGPDLHVHAVDPTGHNETVIHADMLPGRDVHQWLNEHKELIWFNLVN
jgi:hypothetical protein